MKCTRFVRSAVSALSLTGLLLLGVLPARSATVAYWRFEEGPADAQMTHVSGTDGVWSADTADSSGNNNPLSVWTGATWAGYAYRADVPAPTVPNTAAADNFSVQNTGGSPAMWNNTLQTWAPAQWTVEAAFKPEASNSFRTLVGRDSQGAGGTGVSASLAAMYFQIQNDSSVAIKFEDAQGYYYQAASSPGIIKGFTAATDPTGSTGTWYAMAATSDGSKLSLYLADLTAGTGYQLVAQTDMTTSGSTNTALSTGAGSGGDWQAGNFSVGRGLYNGGHVDRAWGFIDEVRLSDTALTPNQFLFAAPSQTEVRGTVTDTYFGKPVQGATVTIGPASTITDSAGKYSLFNKPGTTLPMTVTSPYVESPYSSTVTFPATGSLTKDITISSRPRLVLSTANGFSWKVAANVGSAPDFSAVSADEASFLPMSVPADWDTLSGADNTADGVVGWYRLHFTLPAGFLSALPGRNVIFHTDGIDDADETYLNGTLIGKTGGVPSGATVPVRDAGYDANPTGSIRLFDQGGVIAPVVHRDYVIPASRLNATGDNVLAIKVYDWIGAGGLTLTPSLDVAPAQGTITGTVKAAGAGVAGVRVTAEDASAKASSWAMTDSNGNFSLTGVAVGPTLLGVAKPGYLAQTVSAGNVAGGSTTSVNVTLTAVPDGPAPSLDEFNATDWADKWDAISEETNTTANVPSVTEPGFDVNDPTTVIPGSLTVDGGAGNRGSIISKARINRFASVNAARVVSALAATPDATGTLPNLIFQLFAPTTDDPTQYAYGNVLEMDLEGYGSINGTQYVTMMVWTATPLVNYSTLPVPVPLTSLQNVSPTAPLDLVITRTGTVADFYVNGVWAFGGNFPAMAAYPDHKVAMNSWQTLSGESFTLDWMKAGPLASTTPVKGDLNGNGILDTGDVVTALRIAAGLVASSSADVTAGNVVGTTNNIDVLDAVRLIQGLNGKPL